MKPKTSLRFPARRVAPATLALALAALGVLMPGDSALAQNSGDLEVKLAAQRVSSSPGGKETLQAAERAFPGDIIQYDATYQNLGGKAITNLEPTLPIPAGMHYLPDTARPVPAQASLDGRTFAPIPLKRKVTLPTGEVKEQEVPATEYRALRWNLGEMAPGARTTLIARTRIGATTP